MKPRNVQATLKWTLAAIAVTLILLNSAQAASKYEVLHFFHDKPAWFPQAALVADSTGNLYGTASESDNKCSCGVVFKLVPGSGHKWTYEVIHYFEGPDGTDPQGSLIFDSSGNLYGTTGLGGAYKLGTVFELSPAGSKWREKVLYSFGATHGELIFPLNALTFDAKGNLYGTADGGQDAAGGVFELERSGNGWNEKALYTFITTSGALPSGNLVFDSVGNLYSTTWEGGRFNDGVVFELSPSSGGSWTETVVYNFCPEEYCADGFAPMGGVIFDSAGNLYGTTSSGGLRSCFCGTVFELTPSMGNWTFTVLHNFDGSDGAGPAAGMIFDSAENLYGTTGGGGEYGYGTVFKLVQAGGNWSETVVHSFDEKDGAIPTAGLILDQQGVLYGTTRDGGFKRFGVAFELAPET